MEREPLAFDLATAVDAARSPVVPAGPGAATGASATLVAVVDVGDPPTASFVGSDRGRVLAVPTRGRSVLLWDRGAETTRLVLVIEAGEFWAVAVADRLAASAVLRRVVVTEDVCKPGFVVVLRTADACTETAATSADGVEVLNDRAASWRVMGDATGCSAVAARCIVDGESECEDWGCEDRGCED